MKFIISDERDNKIQETNLGLNKNLNKFVLAVYDASSEKDIFSYYSIICLEGQGISFIQALKLVKATKTYFI